MNRVISTQNRLTEKRPIFHEETCNDSSGPIGFISRVSADRLKGLVGAQTHTEGAITPIRNGQQLQMLKRIVQAGIMELDRTGTTRLSIRSIVDGKLLFALAESLQNDGAKIEAAIPLKNGMTGLQLVYIGYNKPSRRAPPDSSARNREVRRKAEACSVLRKDQLDDPRITTEIVENRASRSKMAETIPLVNMMSEGFGYSREAAIGVLTDSRNIISIVRKDNVIAGMNVTEVREVPLTDGSVLQMAEITDCYVRPEYRGNGYHSKLLQTLMDRHLQRMDVVFTESNSENQTMVNSALRLRHRIAGDGKTIPGILESHAEIENRLRSLFVTYQA